MSIRQRFSPGMPCRLTLTDAIDRAGRAIYGTDWIDGLEQKHVRLLSKYGPEPYGSPNPIIKRPCPPKLGVALDRAIGRNARMTAQHRSVLDWIRAAKVMTDVHHCDGAALERALIQTRKQKNPIGAPAVVRERVAREMREAIQRGQLTMAKLEALKEEAMRELFRAGRRTCVEARKLVRAELGTISN